MTDLPTTDTPAISAIVTEQSDAWVPSLKSQCTVLRMVCAYVIDFYPATPAVSGATERKP